MTELEVVQLVGYLAIRCPHQKFDGMTPDAWAPDLIDIPLSVAQEAVREVTSRQPYCALSELLREAEALRLRRRVATPLPEEPDGLDPDDVDAWLRWSDEAYRRIESGEPVEDRVAELGKPRDTASLMSTLREIEP
jgi:hypothetical protein